MDQWWITPFLKAIASGSSVSEAAQACGIKSSTVYGLKARDADFAESYRLAVEDSVDILETEARRRAVDGVEEPVVYQGQLTPVWERNEDGEVVVSEATGQPRQARNEDGSLKWLTVRKPSDSLLTLLLKGRRKQVFADRTELTGADGGAMVVDSSARAARVAALLKVATDRKTLDDIA